MNPPIRAAEYVRMSTEHQQYSTENQSDALREYAQRRNIEIVRTFCDGGKSGLSINGRDSLQHLIQTVQSGQADFTAVLVYDVSRWGRFQDADESAYYEYICKRAGITVMYCAEQFENDGSPVATIVKGVKRAMAGEYSRELSAKVFRGQCKLIENGYRQGGPAGYGLRRMLIDAQGNTKGELTIGEHKSIQTDRVILVPGPEEELVNVRGMYDQFVNRGWSEKQIAEDLNARGVLTDLGRKWSRGTVREVLTNPKYVGDNVFNRTSFKLKQQHVRNPEDLWVVRREAFEPIVSRDLFLMAKGIMLERSRHFSDAELIERLRTLYQKEGRLSGFLINEAEDLPSCAVFAHRFGSLIRAYELVGYHPERDYGYIEINRRLREMHPQVVGEVVTQLQSQGCRVEPGERGLLSINGELRVSLVIARCCERDNGSHQWNVRLEQGLAPDITIVVRMAPGNERILDYYLLPMVDLNASKVALRQENAWTLDTYRCDSLDYFYELTQRTPISEAA